MNVLDFSVFVFDLDGVIINSEFIHYQCYKKSFKEIINYNLEWNEYCQIHHSISTNFEEKYPEKYKEIYNKKTELYKNNIEYIELVSGFFDFFNLLIKQGKYAKNIMNRY